MAQPLQVGIGSACLQPQPRKAVATGALGVCERVGLEAVANRVSRRHGNICRRCKCWQHPDRANLTCRELQLLQPAAFRGLRVARAACGCSQIDVANVCVLRAGAELAKMPSDKDRVVIRIAADPSPRCSRYGIRMFPVIPGPLHI